MVLLGTAGIRFPSHDHVGCMCHAVSEPCVQVYLAGFNSHFLYKWKPVLSSNCQDGTAEDQCPACTLSVGGLSYSQPALEPKSCMLRRHSWLVARLGSQSCV